MSSGFCTLQWESEGELLSVQGLADCIFFLVCVCGCEVLRRGSKWEGMAFGYL